MLLTPTKCFPVHSWQSLIMVIEEDTSEGS
jgi:hypothetical protein